MAYTALRPCCFAGEKFTVGQSVPAEVIRPGVADALVKMGVIAPQGGQAQDPKAVPAPVEAVTLTVNAEEGDLALTVSVKALQSVIDVLTGAANQAEGIIQDMTEGDALILLHCADSRKTVMAAAEARGKALSEAGEP